MQPFRKLLEHTFKLNVPFLKLDDIIEGCIKGDLKQQELLYSILRAKMFGICLRYSNNKTEAQDILHDGFMTLFASIRNYRGDGHFEAWASKIFVYQSIKANKKWELKKSNYDIQESDFEQNVFDDSILSLLSAKEILELIQKLPSGYRTVFNLYEIEGYSHSEIAQMLNISEGTSKSQLSRAKKLLQEKLKVFKNIS
jgi:RNA polymerase sigma-70 factor (ECF subfamily)